MAGNLNLKIVINLWGSKMCGVENLVSLGEFRGKLNESGKASLKLSCVYTIWDINGLLEWNRGELCSENH